MSSKNWFEKVSTAILVICALTVTSMMVRREVLSSSRGPQKPKWIRDWRAYVSGNERMGPRLAPVTVVVFSDYQCPFCRQLFGAVDRLSMKYPNKISIVYRNFPLSQIHPYARPAALAAQCAADQGQFKPYHDYLFSHQDSLATVRWSAVAEHVGVADAAAFANCLKGQQVIARLITDSIAGVQLGIPGTPLVMVNGWQFDGTPTEMALEELLVRELRRSRDN